MIVVLSVFELYLMAQLLLELHRFHLGEAHMSGSLRQSVQCSVGKNMIWYKFEIYTVLLVVLLSEGWGFHSPYFNNIEYPHTYTWFSKLICLGSNCILWKSTELCIEKYIRSKFFSTPKLFQYEFWKLRIMKIQSLALCNLLTRHQFVENFHNPYLLAPVVFFGI